MQEPNDPKPPIRIMALHALAYCERLFYLDEVEEIRVADHRVYAGRTLHERIDPEGEWSSLTLESEHWGLAGKVDYLRYRDGAVCPYEHKRGRSRGNEAWASDRLQLVAFAALLAEHLDRPVPEGRVRYHANNKTVRVRIDAQAVDELNRAIERARTVARSIDRPPVAENENTGTGPRRSAVSRYCNRMHHRLALALSGKEPANAAKCRGKRAASREWRCMHWLFR